MYAKEVIEEAREEIELIHNLTRGEDRHPRLTPIKELRAVENGCAIFYQSNFGNLKGMKRLCQQILLCSLKTGIANSNQ